MEKKTPPLVAGRESLPAWASGTIAGCEWTAYMPLQSASTPYKPIATLQPAVPHAAHVHI